MVAPKKPVLAPIKDEDREKLGLPEGDLKLKDIVKAQDENKKKNYLKYYRWKHGLYNEGNIQQPDEDSLIMKHENEYRICCVKNTTEQYGGGDKRNLNRISRFNHNNSRAQLNSKKSETKESTIITENSPKRYIEG